MSNTELTDKELFDFDTIDYYFKEYAQLHDIDVNNISVNRFNFILSLIGQKFKSVNYFNYEPNIYQKYNVDLIIYYIDIYIMLCEKYNIIPSLLSFSRFIYIDISTIEKWLIQCEDSQKLNIKQISQIKRILNYRDNAIDDRLANSQQIVGQITLHNDRMLKSKIETISNVIGVENLPKLKGITGDL